MFLCVVGRGGRAVTTDWTKMFKIKCIPHAPVALGKLDCFSQNLSVLDHIFDGAREFLLCSREDVLEFPISFHFNFLFSNFIISTYMYIPPDGNRDFFRHSLPVQSTIGNNSQDMANPRNSSFYGPSVTRLTALHGIEGKGWNTNYNRSSCLGWKWSC